MARAAQIILSEEGSNVLHSWFHSGKQATYDYSIEKRILAKLDESPPKGYAKWNGRLLAKTLGNISKDQIWRVLRKHNISLQRKRSLCISTNPEFTQKSSGDYWALPLPAR